MPMRDRLLSRSFPERQKSIYASSNHMRYSKHEEETLSKPYAPETFDRLENTNMTNLIDSKHVPVMKASRLLSFLLLVWGKSMW